MKIKISIDITADNEPAIARILRGLADDIEGATLKPGDSCALRDSKYNRVGEMRVSS